MVAQLIFAVADDLAEFNGGTLPADPITGEALTPDAANALLRRASSKVEGSTRTARYLTDDDGYPLDANVADALKRAACAWALFFNSSGDIEGSGGRYTSMSNNGVALSGGMGGIAGAIEATTSTEALEILDNAGLLNGVIGRW